MQQFIAMTVVVFLAELGDKTQMATLLFASETRHHPFMVFLAAALALIASAAVAVALGVTAERHLSVFPMKLFAGIGFLMIGVWTIWGHFHH